MGDSIQKECPVAIFCGGDNLRLGRLAGAQAKTLLVTHDSPLLWRLIDQLRAAGFTQIVAATTPRLEFQIAGSIENYLQASPGEGQVDVIVSEEQRRGVVFGLHRLLQSSTAERWMICFGDIFFLANPFPALRMFADAEYDVLGVAPVTFDEELRLGGLVYCDGDRVLSVVERPQAAVEGRPLRWSGIALFDSSAALADLEDFVSESNDDPPPGDFFEFRRRRGRDLRCVSGPDFVNVNSPDQLLLASLYARLEADSAGPAVSGPLNEAARALRRDLARRISSGSP